MEYLGMVRGYLDTECAMLALWEPDYHYWKILAMQIPLMGHIGITRQSLLIPSKNWPDIMYDVSGDDAKRILKNIWRWVEQKQKELKDE
jgi:hypothetical protein